MEGFLVWTPHPCGNSSLALYFILKYCAIDSSLEFPLTFLRVSMDIRLEFHMIMNLFHTHDDNFQRCLNLLNSVAIL